MKVKSYKMRKAIFRNVAVVSAIFVASFAIMLITNYFQVRSFNPLQADVMETLKKINDENANNVALQEQIRQLDLMARRAYFVNLDHLKTGIYLLLAMLGVLIVCLRFYFAGEKDIPGKQIDVVDDWIIKTHARKYVGWFASALVAVALVFVFVTASHLRGTDAPNTPSTDIGQIAAVGDESTAQGESNVNQANQTRQGEENTVQGNSDDNATQSLTTIDNASDISSGFRGNNSNAISSAKNIPDVWDLKTGKNIAWKSAIPKHGFNSPVVSGNKVFLTGADESAREIYCYDLRTGKLLWTLAATNIPGSPQVMPKTTDDTGLASSTAATNGKQVCAIFATGDLLCADMDGKRLWAKNLGVPDNHYGYASSLLAFGNSLIVQYDNTNAHKVVALDMATGNEVWSKTRTDKITWSSPTLVFANNRAQLILMGNPAITAYNPANGEQYWRVDGLSGEVASSPCGAGGLVFGASEYAALIAVDATSGKKLWTANNYLPEISSPVATNENVYLGTTYGVLACYDAKTGALKHSHELETEFYSSPMIVEGRLYVFSNDGKMHIYTADSEFTLINSFETGAKTFATPAFIDGKIVVRSEEGLYCVATKK
ncbi:hypothetical protein FACS1894199_11340 [Bacteroidia bacterium]|nr:hypothetical protein FACS1894199_11340 [Bacteroidia bacterium]